MAQISLIGIGAGVAAALLFASATMGGLLSSVLFLLAPLPIMIVALGWSHWVGLVATAVAAAGLAAIFGTAFALFFLIGLGLPAWWLGYLALLARPVAAAPSLEWYPVGNLVLWAAVLGALVVVAAIPQFGTDEDTFRTALRNGFERAIRLQAGTPADAPLELPGISDPKRVIDVMVLVTPPFAALFATFTNLIDLWLAGRIVKTSGRLKRPWPDIMAMKFPPYAVALFALAVAGSFLAGLPGVMSGVLAATMLLAYTVLGFAVLHAISRNMASRGLVLTGAYALVIVFGWPMLVMTLLGLADSALDLRARAATKGGPPAQGKS
jgi:hypothetical protein